MSRAVVRTPLPDAPRVAAAVAPDNTPELSTSTVDGAVVTTITRGTASGLRATLDDYLVNLAVAHQTGTAADRNANGALFTDDTPTDTS